MKKLWQILILVVLVGALGAGPVSAFTTNLFTNAVGTVQWSTATNWDPNSVPSDTNTIPLFANSAATMYTVQLSGASTSGPLQVATDKVTFDLAGQRWYTAGPSWGAAPPSAWLFSYNAGETSTVVFTSSAAPAVTGGNTFQSDTGARQMRIGAGATLRIDNSGGYPVSFDTRLYQIYLNGSCIVSGQNVMASGWPAEYSDNGGIGGGGSLYVLDGAVATNFSFNRAVANGLVYVDNAKIVSAGQSTLYGRAGMPVGILGTGTVILTNNAVYDVTGDISLGYNIGTGYLTVDGSTINGLTINGTNGSRLLVGTANGGGSATVRNGSTVTFGAVSVRTGNNLVMENSTLILGGGVVTGTMTNQGTVRASGTIRGAGSSPALVRNEKFLHVGNSIGTLAMSNVNLHLTAASTNYFEFDPSLAGSGDAINITAGTALIDGALIFSNYTGATTLAFGKWNFITADVITNDAWFDNLTSIIDPLTNTLPSILYAGYTYGVVDLLDGSQALQLSINMIPEPSTILLVVGGGLVLWRCRKRR